ncbi:MAG: peptidoglycan DD-metalloendopeptidase family protein [Acidobacteria bacterium]|nr:peptidoglycan DD-metalloendopeptidase family protein [Acidobacteriota bacterium]
MKLKPWQIVSFGVLVLFIVIPFLFISIPHPLPLKRFLEKPPCSSGSETDKWLEGKILPGKGFEDSILAVDGFGLRQAMGIVNALRGEVDFRRLKAGQRFRLLLSPDGKRIVKFVFEPDIITRHSLVWNEEKKIYDYKLTVFPTKKRIRLIEGEIQTTLNQALKGRGGISSHLRNIANGVLECLVNLRRYARRGDRYRLLVEDRLYNGKLVPPSRILYVSYRGKRAGFHEGFRYDDEKEGSIWTGHYDRKGRALVYSSLRYPLNRIHVTSAFGWRRHPVTGKRSFHYGVDLRARVGTPVFAVAKGRVVRSGYRKPDGKFIELRHRDGTRTYYLHLSRILVGKGQVVRSHQEIALSGKTGRVTAPHLHFGIRAPNGKWLNPMSVRMIAAAKLPKRKMARFRKQVKEIQKQLSRQLEMAEKAAPLYQGSHSFQIANASPVIR